MSVSFVGYLLMEIWKAWETDSELTRAIAREVTCSLTYSQIMRNNTVNGVVEQFGRLLNDADCVRFDQTSSAAISRTMDLVLEKASSVQLDDSQTIKWLVSWLDNINDSLSIRVLTTVILRYTRYRDSPICRCFGSVPFHHYLGAMNAGKKREAANWLELVKTELDRPVDQIKDEKDTVHCCYQSGYSGYSVPNDNSGTLEENKNED